MNISNILKYLNKISQIYLYLHTEVFILHITYIVIYISIIDVAVDMVS